VADQAVGVGRMEVEAGTAEELSVMAEMATAVAAVVVVVMMEAAAAAAAAVVADVKQEVEEPPTVAPLEAELRQSHRGPCQNSSALDLSNAHE
jgi:hypothetical protein